MDTRKVLIISYYFGHRTTRLLGLAKHLPKFGWSPYILTSDAPDDRYSVPNLYCLGSTDMISSTRASLPINPKRIPTPVKKLWEEFRCYPDPMKGWYQRINDDSLLNLWIDGNHFDMVLSSGPPHSAHLASLAVKKHLGIPWVADLRDLWTAGAYYHYHQPRKTFEQRLEKKVLSQADAIVTTSQIWADDEANLLSKPVFEITNGFEPRMHVTMPRNDKFTLTYAGQLYQGRRSPIMLREAIKDMDINLQLFTFEGDKRLPREQVLEKEAQSDALLLLLWDDPREIGTYTGKVFEYLSMKKPILAIGPEGSVVQRLLEKTNAGIFVSNLQDCRAVMESWYAEWKATGQVRCQSNEIEVNRYTHEKMAESFAKLFEKVKP